MRVATRVTVLSLVAGLVGISFLLAVRRVVGAVTLVFPWDATVIIALATILIVTAVRTTWRKSFPLDIDQPSGSDQLVGWGTSAVLVLTAIGCSFPGGRVGDWLIWLPVVVVDQFLRQSLFSGGRSAIKVVEPDEVRTVWFDIPAELARDQVVQQLHRMRDTQGREVIYGTLRADFECGQRTAVLHVGFCPPLAYLPRIDAAARSDGAATIKVVQALAHGARLDVRLSEAATQYCRVWIEMAVTPPLSS